MSFFQFSIQPNLPSFYTPAQVRQYTQRIGFDVPDLLSHTFTPDLETLANIMRLHLLAFPFDTTELHYAESHQVDTSPDVVYDRMITRCLGGSWCCGLNGFFMYMLRGLGYRVLPIAARVNMSQPASPTPHKFTFLTHLVLIVQISPSDSLYLVDVGFGGNGPVRPIPFPLSALMRTPLSSSSPSLSACQMEIEHVSQVQGGAPPEHHRLSLYHHPLSALVPSALTTDWALQYRCTGSERQHQEDWSTLYIFKAIEVINHHDWVPFAQWLSTYPVDLFQENVLVVKYFIVDQEDGSNDGGGEEMKIIGRITMVGNKIFRRVGAKSELLKEFKTERERVQILRDEFGIVVKENDIRNITKWKAALPLE